MVLSLQPAGDYLIQSRHSVFLFKKISKNSSCMPGYCRSLWRRSCLRECPSGSCSFSRALFSALQIPGWTQHWLTLHLYYLYVWVYVCIHECVCVSWWLCVHLYRHLCCFLDIFQSLNWLVPDRKCGIISLCLPMLCTQEGLIILWQVYLFTTMWELLFCSRLLTRCFILGILFNLHHSTRRWVLLTASF